MDNLFDGPLPGISLATPEEDTLYRTMLQQIRTATGCDATAAYRALDPVFRGIWLRALGLPLAKETVAQQERV